MEQVNSYNPGARTGPSVYWSKGWWRWWRQLDYWSYKSCKAPVKSSPPTSSFYRLDALPVTQPTVSKHWREKSLYYLLCRYNTHQKHFRTNNVKKAKLCRLFKISVKCVYRWLGFLAFCSGLIISLHFLQPTSKSITFGITANFMNRKHFSTIMNYCKQ